jgi:hypothetical protein
MGMAFFYQTSSYLLLHRSHWNFVGGIDLGGKKIRFGATSFFSSSPFFLHVFEKTERLFLDLEKAICRLFSSSHLRQHSTFFLCGLDSARGEKGASFCDSRSENWPTRCWFF